MKFPRNGYTVIELLVMLSICAILAAVLLTVFSRPRENVHRASCPANLKQIGLGFLQYAQDHDERLPPIALNTTASQTQPYGWADALQPYIKSTQIYHCPEQNAFPETGEATQNGYTDYWFNAQLNARSVTKIATPATTFFAGEGNDGRDITDARYHRSALPMRWLESVQSPSRRHNDEANYLFADGHVKTYLPRGAFEIETATTAQ